MAIDVLIRAKKDDDRDGWVLLPGKRSFPVVRVQRRRLAEDIRQNLPPKQWNRIIGIFQTRAAINRDDVFAVVKAAAKIRGVDRSNLRPQLTSEDKLFARFGGLMSAVSFQNEHLKGARLVIWGHSDRKRVRKVEGGVMLWSMDLGVLCEDLTTALFVYEALGDLRACPCCGNPFQPFRPDQDYCSVRCRETFRKRRLRAKAKEGEK